MKVLKFSSKDCGACKMIAPMVKRVCTKYGVKLQEIDVDEQPNTAAAYNVQSLPTLIIADEELAPLDMLVGTTTEAEFSKFLDSWL